MQRIMQRAMHDPDTCSNAKPDEDSIGHTDDRPVDHTEWRAVDNTNIFARLFGHWCSKQRSDRLANACAERCKHCSANIPTNSDSDKRAKLPGPVP